MTHNKSLRICVLSKYNESSNWLYQGTIDSLRDLNISVLNINISKERNEEAPHWNSIPSLPSPSPLPQDSEIVRKIAEFDPDQLWVLSYSGIPFINANGSDLKRKIKSLKIIYWTGDLAESVNDNPYLGSLLDFIFLNDEQTIPHFKQRWNNQNVIYMPHGTIPAAQPNEHPNYSHAVCFLGRRQKTDTRYEERNSVLEGFDNAFGLFEADNITTPDQVHSFYRASKMTVGISWNNHAYLYTSDRVFNAMGSDTFCLHFYFPGIEKLFVNKKHLVWFKTIEEGLSVARYYLENENERQKIARTGYELAISKHTYLHRIKNILQIISHEKVGFDGFL